jgi:adenylate cyclase
LEHIVDKKDMATEIEHKFLVKNNHWETNSQKQYHIKQGYLSTDPKRTVRVRIKNDKGFLTIKSGQVGTTRSEFEYPLPLADAEALLLLCDQPIIDKIRHEVHHEGFTWEIDVFRGQNHGLIVAEIELEEENQTFILPEWVGQEVTQDIRYYNSHLMRLPFCDWE